MAFSFGQPAQAASVPAQASSFSFGGTSTAQKTPANTAGFSFGAPAQAQQQLNAGGLFGGGSGSQLQQQQPQQQSSSGLFGNANNQQQQQQQQGGFGSSLFGNAGPQQQPRPPFGMSNNNNTNNNTTGNLFGTSQQQQQQQQQPAFGNNQATGSNPLTLSQLGSQPPYQQQQNRSLQQSNGFLGMAGASAGGATGKDNNAQKRLGIPVNDKLEAIRAAWDVRDLQACRFLFYFYNAIPQNMPALAEASLSNPNFCRRQDAVGPRHDAMWLQTLRENPDRSRLVPVLAVGFPEVKARLEMQQVETQRQSNKLLELRKRLEELTSKHTLSNSVRIAAISRKQTSLHHRIISIARRIHLLIPALRGQSVTLKEEQLKSILQNCEMELESISLGLDGRPNGGIGGNGNNHNYTTRLRGRINELWALLGNVKAKREATMANDSTSSQWEWAVVDETALEDVAKILSSQQQGLDHLSTTLQSDTRALDTIIKGLEGVELTGTK
ncbi:hypothetical protein CBS101457_004272 [Exobasidium rhododendri]|nr:hypothetical protein CBS101457_004272 [Exobasidium rhododendri]